MKVRQDTPYRRLATNGGEKCGLALLPFVIPDRMRSTEQGGPGFGLTLPRVARFRHRRKKPVSGITRQATSGRTAAELGHGWPIGA